MVGLLNNGLVDHLHELLGIVPCWKLSRSGVVLLVEEEIWSRYCLLLLEAGESSFTIHVMSIEARAGPLPADGCAESIWVHQDLLKYRILTSICAYYTWQDTLSVFLNAFYRRNMI